MNGVDAGADVTSCGEVVTVDGEAASFHFSEGGAGYGRGHAHAFVDAGAEVGARVESGVVADLGGRGEGVPDFVSEGLVDSGIAAEVEEAGG